MCTATTPYVTYHTQYEVISILSEIIRAYSQLLYICAHTSHIGDFTCFEVFLQSAFVAPTRVGQITLSSFLLVQDLMYAPAHLLPH